MPASSVTVYYKHLVVIYCRGRDVMKSESEMIENALAALENTSQGRKHFVSEWLDSDVRSEGSRGESGVGCGCGCLLRSFE